MAQFRLGRKRPASHYRVLLLKNYLLKTYAPPPVSIDWMAKATSSIEKVYLNQTLGCCVISWGAHLEGILTANVRGTPVLYSDAQIIQMYSAVGGYDPGNPDTDQGCDEETFLNYVQQNGFAGGTKIAGWIRVNAADPQEVRAAIDLFGAVTITMELPDEWLQNPPDSSGFTWDKAGPPDPYNGHCIGAGTYQPGKVKISTWGMWGWLTDAALASYATVNNGGGCYAVLTEDWIDQTNQKSPSGFEFSQLQIDLNSMG
jgi:hypothetical protein